MNSDSHSPTPRYIEVAANGHVIRQESTIPPDVVVNYLGPNLSGSTMASSYNTQWSNYSQQDSSSKKWWQSSGTFNPYRTTYQDYGKGVNQSIGSNTTYYSQPYPYNQATYSQQNSMSYNSAHPPQHIS